MLRSSSLSQILSCVVMVNEIIDIVTAFLRNPGFVFSLKVKENCHYQVIKSSKSATCVTKTPAPCVTKTPAPYEATRARVFGVSRDWFEKHSAVKAFISLLLINFVTTQQFNLVPKLRANLISESREKPWEQEWTAVRVCSMY